jgi:hypothetical protein
MTFQLLSMLQTYILNTPLLIIPWSYDITKILLFYVNYPQNIDIQAMVGTILPHFIEMLSGFVQETGIEQSSQPNAPVDPADLRTYLCYQSRPNFFSPFLVKQQQQQQQPQQQQQQSQPTESTYFYTPSNPSMGSTLQMHLGNNNNSGLGSGAEPFQLLKSNSVKEHFLDS